MVKYLLFLFAAMLPLTDVTQYYLGMASASEILLILLVIVALATFAADPSIASVGMLMILVIAVLVVLSWLYGGGQEGLDAPVLKYKPVGHDLEYVLAFFAIAVLGRTSRARAYLLTGLWTGCVVALAFAFVQWVVGPQAYVFWHWGPDWATLYAEYGRFRVWGSLSNPLNLVTYLAPFLGLGVSSYVAATRWQDRLFYGGTILAIVVVLITTGSKTALVVLIIPFIVFLRSTGLLATLGAAATSLALVWVSGVGRVLLERGHDPTVALESITQRRYVFVAALRMMRDYPLLGVGPGNFRDVYPTQYWTSLASKLTADFTPENMFLMIGAEQGLIVLLLVGALLVRGVTTMFVVTVTDRPETKRDAAIARTVAVALVCYVVSAQTHAATAVATNLAVFSLLGVQEALRIERSEHERVMRTVFVAVPSSTVSNRAMTGPIGHLPPLPLNGRRRLGSAQSREVMQQ